MELIEPTLNKLKIAIAENIGQFIYFNDVPSILIKDNLHITVCLTSSILRNIILVLNLFCYVLFLIHLFSIT